MEDQRMSAMDLADRTGALHSLCHGEGGGEGLPQDPSLGTCSSAICSGPGTADVAIDTGEVGRMPLSGTHWSEFSGRPGGQGGGGGGGWG